MQPPQRLLFELSEPRLERGDSLGGAHDAVDLRERSGLGGELCILDGRRTREYEPPGFARDRAIEGAAGPTNLAERVPQTRVDHQRSVHQATLERVGVDGQRFEVVDESPVGGSTSQESNVLRQIGRWIDPPT